VKSTSAFVAGIGLGLLFGTKAGRERLDQLKGWVTETWYDPRVQDQVTSAQEKARQYVQEQGAALRDQMRPHPEA
jgi:hypothetical protein